MLPKEKRLTRDEFSRFFVSGKRTHAPAFQIIYTPSPATKVAVVVGKKVYKKAVDRNQLRRQLYHIVRDWLVETGSIGVYIVITKPAVRDYTYKQLKTSVTEILTNVR